MQETRKWINGTTVTGDSAHLDKMIKQLDTARQKELATKARWGRGDERMTTLCTGFPTLRGVPGTDPWDAIELLSWLVDSGAPTGGSRYAAAFCLQVWNCSEDWAALAMQPRHEGGLGLRKGSVHLEPFNVVRAHAVWDDEHARAFRAWVENPFHP